MRVSLTIRIQVSISYYASVLVFCMMDIWMFSLAKICRHASLKQGATSMPTNGAKDSIPPPLSIITKNTFHGLPYVTCYE